MALFPTLSMKPSADFNEETISPTLRSDFEAGYVHSRPRYTRLRKIFSVNYPYLIPADKTALNEFITTVKGGANSFTWVHPVGDTSHTVRFTEVPKWKYVSWNLWSVSFTLEEV